MLAPSHFSAALMFAAFTSTVFGITQRSTPKGMVRYGLYCFAMFLLAVIVISWGMHLIRH